MTDQIQALFAQMAEIRAAEEALLDLFAEGLIRGTVHTSIGQEATAVGVASVLDRNTDVICSNHRGHGHFLAHTGNLKGLLAEIMGKTSGICGGIGGSQHLHYGNFYSNGILAGMAPVAVGMAFAEKFKNQRAVVTLFIGDGAMAEGAAYEALNMASLWRLPIMFVVEQNCYAQSTYWKHQHAGKLEKRGESFGIPIIDIEGNDVLEVRHATEQAVGEIRSGRGPQILFLRTYRLGPHSKGDDLRDPAEIARFRENEPFVFIRRHLGEETCNRIEAEMRVKVAGIIDELKMELP